jgi:putative ABC transport system permease protein
MVKVALKSIRARLGRVLTTAIAVMLGVAFVAGTLVLSDTILRVFNDLFADVNEGTDAVVRSASEVEAEFGQEVRTRVDAGLLSTVQSTDGVADAEGFVQGFAQFVDPDGDEIGNPGQGAPTLGFSWPEVDDLNPFVLADGEPPRGPDQVVVDKATADAEGFAVDDTITILTKEGPGEYTVAGIARFGTADSPAGATVALFSLAEAQRVLAEPGVFDTISAVAQDGVSQEELKASLEESLAAAPDAGEVEVLTGEEITEETQDSIAENLSFFTTFLLVFAVVALIVGGFVIYNTFGILVAQRSRELALLRAVGAGRGQVIGSVLIEALAVGVVGSVLGIGLGVLLAAGLRALLNQFGLDIPDASLVIAARTVVIGLLVGVVVTAVSAVAPALRAARIPPIAAMRAVAHDTSGHSRRRIVIGLLITAVGVVLLVRGLFGGGENALISVGGGALLVFVGVTALGPVLARPVTRFIGAPLPRVRGITGKLARENAMRNPRRTASTAAALMIGVGLVGLITIVAASARASIEKIVDDSFTGDFVIDSGTFGFGGISPELADELNQLPEVRAATGIRVAFAEIDGQGQGIIGVDPETAFDIVDIGVLQGAPEDLDERAIAIHEDVAEDDGLEIGSEIPVRFADTGEQPLRVAMIYSENQLAGNYLIGRSAYEANVADQFDFQVYVLKSDDASTDEARAAIEQTAEPFANAEVEDLSEFKQSQLGQINQILYIVYALLALAVVIALFGIANTLALSIIERTHELGLLRAVGMTRRQLRSSVRWESVLTAVFGTLLGLAIGLFFGLALGQALKDEGLEVLRVPVGQLVVIVVVAGLAGVLAAVLPARRASRLDVLDAIFDE